jgi:hypothetical protein
VTSLLLQLLAQHGPVLEGPSYRGAEGSVRAAVVQLEGYVWDLLGTNPAEQPPRQPLPAPQYHVASLDDTMAAAVMDGSCLSLVRYALAAVAANPEAYAHVSFVTPQDRHAALAKLYGEQAYCTGSWEGGKLRLHALVLVFYRLCTVPTERHAVCDHGPCVCRWHTLWDAAGCVKRSSTASAGCMHPAMQRERPCSPYMCGC